MKLTIITINYNNCLGLEKTLESISIQTNRDFEYIVIDGASTDGSVEIINKYAQYIDYYVSEPDKGIYDAMNKGALQAHGLYLMYLNSGDRLINSEAVSLLLEQRLEADICFCKVKNMRSDGTYYMWSPPAEEVLSLQYLRWNTLHHPGAVIRTELQKRFLYNTKLRICSDRQFFIEALIIADATYQTLDLVMNEFAPQGTSGAQAEKEMEKEDTFILESLFTKRQRRDIERTNWMLQQITTPLVHFYGKARMVCSINRFIFKILGVK